MSMIAMIPVIRAHGAKIISTENNPRYPATTAQIERPTGKIMRIAGLLSSSVAEAPAGLAESSRNSPQCRHFLAIALICSAQNGHVLEGSALSPSFITEQLTVLLWGLATAWASRR